MEATIVYWELYWGNIGIVKNETTMENQMETTIICKL